MTLNIKAPIFSKDLQPNFDLPALIEFVKERFTACGFDAPVEDNDNNRFGYTLKLSDNTYGTVKYWLQFTNRSNDILIDSYLYANENYDYDTWTELSRNSGVKQIIYITRENPLTIYAIDNQFMGLVFTESGNKYKGFMGIAYPNFLDWYDENQWMRAMLVNVATPNTFAFPMPNPSNRTNLAAKSQIEDFSLRNPKNIAQTLGKPYVTIAGKGIGAQFNRDIALSNNKGFDTNNLSVDKITNEEWWNLFCGDNGIAILSA